MRYITCNGCSVHRTTHADINNSLHNRYIAIAHYSMDPAQGFKFAPDGHLLHHTALGPPGEFEAIDASLGHPVLGPLRHSTDSSSDNMFATAQQQHLQRSATARSANRGITDRSVTPPRQQATSPRSPPRGRSPLGGRRMLLGVGDGAGGSSNGYCNGGSYGSRGVVDVRAAEVKERERYLNRLAAAAQVSAVALHIASCSVLVL
jgi:hypothetical protein